MPNNSQKTYKDLPTALRAIADDLISGKFEQNLQSEDSSTSETKETEQPEDMKTLEIRFVPHLRKASQAEKSVKFIQIVGYPRPPQAPSSKKLPTTPPLTKAGWIKSLIAWFVG